jgi:hypothetical protein
MSNILVITGSLSNEISLSVVADFTGCHYKKFTVEELNLFNPINLIDFINNFVYENNKNIHNEKINKVILVGSYWSFMLNYLKSIPNIKIIILNSSKTIHEDLIKLTNYSKKDELNKLTNYSKMEELIKDNQKLFELLNAKYNSDNNKILETEILFSALATYKSLPTLSARFECIKDILSKKIKFDDIMTQGLSIFKSNLILCVNRAENNSHIVKLKDGTLAAITCATELLDLTHEKLHEKYPEIKVTITTALQFQKDNKTALSLSIRTYDNDISVKNIVLNINTATNSDKTMGFNSNNACGGRINFEELKNALIQIDLLSE